MNHTEIAELMSSAIKLAGFAQGLAEQEGES